MTHIPLSFAADRTSQGKTKKTKVFYWIFTSLFAFLMLGSALPDIASSSIAVTGFKAMGYPAYLVPFIGTAKFLGVVAILIPGFPRLKEWAYAGLIIDLTGATYSIFLSNPLPATAAFMILPISLGIVSYVFYQKKLKLELA